MARPNLFRHRKFERLVHDLNQPLPSVVGLLEVMWSRCYEDGDPYLGDRVDVELAAKWYGEPGVFADALIAAGFVDEDEDGRCSVHDLMDHAPDYVRKRAQREAERRTTSATRGGVSAKRRTTADTDRRSAQNGSTPAPAPAPSSGTEPESETRSVLHTAEHDWNELATTIGLKKIRKLTIERRLAVLARVAEHGAESVRVVYSKIRASPYLSGKTKRSPGATFDWTFRPYTYLKILEGNYDPRGDDAPSFAPLPYLRDELGAGMDPDWPAFRKLLDRGEVKLPGIKDGVEQAWRDWKEKREGNRMPIFR